MKVQDEDKAGETWQVWTRLLGPGRIISQFVAGKSLGFVQVYERNEQFILHQPVKIPFSQRDHKIFDFLSACNSRF